MAQLLVSVRSVGEASDAFAGGADLIDVKEPAAGPLGRADDGTIAAVVRYVDGRVPVSAACGELREAEPGEMPAGLAYVKWGLAGSADDPDWRGALTAAAARLGEPVPRPVAVAYADWKRAAAPRPAEIATFACRQQWPAFLVDTWLKDGNNLLDWLSLEELGRLREECRKAGVRIAVAGALGVDQVEMMRGLDPDWFAVRGAACRSGERGREIDAARVGRLVECIRALTPATSSN